MNLKLVVAILLTWFLFACGSGGVLPRDLGELQTQPAYNGERVLKGDSIFTFCAPYINAINRAYPGDTSFDMLNLENYYSGVDTDAEYIFLIGINDIIDGIEDGYINRMARIFNHYIEKDVTVISILPTFSKQLNREVIKQNAALENLTGLYGFKYQNVYETFTSGAVSNSIYYFDEYHLNESGCDLLFNQALGKDRL